MPARMENEVHKQLPWTFMLIALLCLAPAVHAADSQEGTLVTDPATLASMGFSADAIVYLAPGAVNEAVPVPQPYGGADPIQVAFAGNQFQGRASTYAYSSPTGGGDVSYVSGDNFADAHMHLPSGAVLESARFWVSDSNAGADIGAILIRSCLPTAGPGSPANTVLVIGSSTGATGDQSIVITPPATTIDNNGCIYFARARFDAAGHILRKARVQYRLQVSPAPAAATFPNDVPTTHPFFRFVEAMAKSGLTGGCAPGSFCPDNPVTRGQLSVFLSVALGLHFPN